MLDNQVLEAWSGVQEDLVRHYESPYDRVYSRQRHERHDPLGIPAGDPAPADHDMRGSILSGLAAVVSTMLLFAGGIAAVLVPSPALAGAGRVILL